MTKNLVLSREHNFQSFLSSLLTALPVFYLCNRGLRFKISHYCTGLEKTLNSGLTFWQTALKFCMPGAVAYLSLSLQFFYNFVGRRPAWAFAHRTSEHEKLLAQQRNLLVPFLSPDYKILNYKACSDWMWGNFAQDYLKCSQNVLQHFADFIS